MLECVPSSDAIRKFPSHVVTFLENKLEWISLNNNNMSRTKPEECNADEIVDVEPLHVHCKCNISFSCNLGNTI